MARNIDEIVIDQTGITSTGIPEDGKEISIDITAPRQSTVPTRSVYNQPVYDTSNIVDPRSINIPKEQNEEAPNVMQAHFSEMDAAIDRKKKEFAEYIRKMEEESAENEMLVADGVDEVAGELEYIPPTMKETLERAEAEASGEEYHEMDEVERDLENEIALEQIKEKRNATIHQATPKIVTPVIEDEIEDPLKDIADTMLFGDDMPEEPAKEEKIEEEAITPLVHPTVLKRTRAEDNVKLVAADFSINDEDFDAEEVETTEEEIEKMEGEGFKSLQSDILKKIQPISKSMDISAFKISKKATTVSRVLSNMKDYNVDVVDWALMSTGRPFKASALSGSELFMLDTYDSTKNRLSMNIQQAKILYKHDMNPYKPKSFEAWTKTLSYKDIDHIYAAFYAANYKGSNYIPYSCTNKKTCNNMYLSEQIDIMESMVKFKNDAAKAEFNKIRTMQLTEANSGAYESIIVPITEDLAIGFKAPTMYNTLFENAALDEAFSEKYASIILIIGFIDMVYEINSSTGSLDEIQWKEYPEDISKNIKSKISTYSKIFNKLSTDEHSVILSYINAMADNDDKVTYVIPASKCPKCETEIPEQPTYAKEALFTRRQLATIATTSIDS